MKTSVKCLIAAALFMSAGSAFAQTPNPNDEKQCSNGNTCLENNSLYFEYAKQKNYKEAYEFWKPLYEAAPDYNKNVYIVGETILKTLINDAIRAKDAETRKALVDELLKLCDDRIKYFGDDAKMPAAKILGNKAIYYLTLNGTYDVETAYGMLSESVDALKEEADAKVLVQWVNLSQKKFQKDASFKGDYIANYMKGSEYIDGSLDNWYKRLETDYKALEADAADAKAAKDTVTCKQFIDFIKTQKTALTGNFASSGAASVDILVEVFEPQIESKKEDATFLNNVSKLLGRTKAGRETELYFKVSEYSYRLAPSMASAKGMAGLSLKNEDYEGAVKFLDESLSFAVQPEDKAEILMMEARIYGSFMKNYSKARSICQQCMPLDRTSADPYIYIADLYAQSANSASDDAIIRRFVYVAAVEQLQRAKSIEPDRAEISQKIGSYRAGFPSKADAFKKGISTGNTVQLGGWMSISVTCPDLQ